MRTPTSADMALLAGRLRGYALLLQQDHSDVKISNVIQDLITESQNIAEQFTDIDVERYYPNEN